MDQLPNPSGGDVNRALASLLVTWIGCGLSFGLVACRVYCRTRLTRNMWWDDYCMCLTMVFAFVYSALFTVEAVKGGARHLKYLEPQQLMDIVKFEWFSQAVSIIAIAISKVSVAILIARIMGSSRWRRWLLYFLSISSLVLGIIAFVLVYAQCSPPRALWEGASRKCWPRSKIVDFLIACSCYYLVVDLALAFIPTTVIWKLNLSVRKRIGLSVLLGLGVFAAVCAAVRTSYLPTLASESPTVDYTWITVDLMIWTSLEVNVTIIAACIPTVRPLFFSTVDTFQSSPRNQKTHRRLHNPEDRHLNLHNLHKISTRVVGGVSPPAPMWHRQESQADILPYNRIREVIEMDVRYEDRKEGVGRDEENVMEIPQHAMSTKNVV